MNTSRSGELRLVSDRGLLTGMLWLLIIPPLWFAVQDAWFLPRTAELVPRVLIRSLPLFPPAIGLLFVGRVRTWQAFSRLAFLIGCGLAVAILANNILRPDSEDVPLRGRIIAIVFMYFVLPNSMARQIGPPLALTAALIMLRAIRVDGPASAMAGDIMFLAMLNGAGVLMVWRRLALERAVDEALDNERDARIETERALADLKTLRGIIPICAHCKRIRSEVGDWQQIEQYVRDHSEAEFSHGICPACTAIHFPTQAVDKRG